MLSLRKIAVTGGLSSGKSTVCCFFKELGAYVVSADDIVHQLLSSRTDLGQEIISLLGNEIVVDGNIDRKLIAKQVFNNQALLMSLENLLHPAVMAEIENQYRQIQKQGKAPLFVAEIPLLFEASAEEDFDHIIVVLSSSSISRHRFISAGNTSEEYDKRMARQLAPEEKARRADYVINNKGTKQELKTIVTGIFNKLSLEPA
jgi:dephospho-CoA kinase